MCGKASRARRCWRKAGSRNAPGGSRDGCNVDKSGKGRTQSGLERTVAPQAAYRAGRYLEEGCGTVLSKAPEGWPPEDPLGAAGAFCPAPLGEALGEPPTLVSPMTPVGAAPGDAVAPPDGTLFEDCGALCPELGEGGDCVAPDWANAGAAISPALSSVAAKAVRTFGKMELPGMIVEHIGG